MDTGRWSEKASFGTKAFGTSVWPDINRRIGSTATGTTSCSFLPRKKLMRWLVKHKRVGSAGALSRRFFASKMANGSNLWPWPLQSALTWFHAAVASVGGMNFCLKYGMASDLLVVQTDIRTPDVIGRHVEHVHSAVLGRFPL
jgi:hypothetical protein